MTGPVLLARLCPRCTGTAGPSITEAGSPVWSCVACGWAAPRAVATRLWELSDDDLHLLRPCGDAWPSPGPSGDAAPSTPTLPTPESS